MRYWDTIEETKNGAYPNYKDMRSQEERVGRHSKQENDYIQSPYNMTTDPDTPQFSKKSKL